MKTLRLFTFLVLTALTILSPMDSVWSAPPPEAFLSEADPAGGQVSGTVPNSRAGLMTLQGLTGRNELTYGALPTGGFEMIMDNHYWNEEFYRGNVFLPWNVTPGTDYFFTNIALGVTADGQGLANLGSGYAYYMKDWDRLLRGSLWLDVDDEHSDTYYQLGYHGENLGKYIDVRFDAAFVLDAKERTLFDGLTGDTVFRGRNLFFEGLNITETPLHHIDAEVGGPLAYLGDYGISVYGKAFYLFNTDNEEKTFGYGIRGEWAITEDVTLNVNHTRDDIFEDSTWFSLVFTTPDGAPRNFARPISVRERFSKPFIRTGRVPVTTDVQSKDIIALNPKDSNPYIFAHVDPNAGGGNGTFENPFGSIDQLIAANTPGAGIDVIYVRPESGGNQMNLQASLGNNLILQDNQFLLGSTIAHSLPVLNSPFGPTVAITPLDPGAARPRLTNGNVAPGAVVYAADGNTIAGLTIDGSGLHDGIRGDGNSILGDLIDDNVIRMITVTDNQFTNTNIGINLPDLSDGLPMPGMPIWSTISRNSFTNNNVAFDVGINTNNNDPTDVDTFDGETLTMVMNGNTVQGNLEGGILRSQGPDALLDLRERDLDGNGSADSVASGNVFANNGGNGLSIFVETGGQIFADIGALAGTAQDIADPRIANRFAGNAGNGLFVSVISSEQDVSRINMRNNLFADNQLSGASIETGGDAVLVINGTRNIYMDNAMHGLEINSFNNSSLGNPFTITEPNFALLDADPTGILFGNLEGADPLSLVFPSASTFRGEYFIGNGEDGAHILAQSDQTVPTPVTNESWQNIAFLFDDGAGANGNRRNVFLNNGNDGIRIINDAVATVDGNNPVHSYYTIRGTEIGNSGADGIHIELLGAESSLFAEHTVSRYGPNVITIGGQSLQDRVFAVNNGDQGVQVVVDHFDIGMFNNNRTASSVGAFDQNFNFVPDRFYIDQFSAIQNGGDGFEILVGNPADNADPAAANIRQSASDVNFNMFRSNLVQNGGVGLEMNVNSANDFQLFQLDATDGTGVPQPLFFPSAGSVFNIGSEIAGTGNLFQSNTLQGVFFQTLSPVDESGNIRFSNVVFGVISNDAVAPTPSQDVQVTPGELQDGDYASVEDTLFFTLGRLNFYDNVVQTNGTQANGADGLALSVGTSTNMIASIAQNRFGGNAGSDLNIVAVVSQNPEDSENNRFTGPNRDLLAPDPIGILDLALGLNFADPAPPVSGKIPGNDPFDTSANVGAQFTVNTLGISTPLAGRSELGIFTNSDLIKPANRHGFIVINAYNSLVGNDLDDNVWSQSGSTVGTLLNADFLIGGEDNTSGLGGKDGLGLITFPFSTVNFIPPGSVFP